MATILSTTAGVTTRVEERNASYAPQAPRGSARVSLVNKDITVVADVLPDGSDRYAVPASTGIITAEGVMSDSTRTAEKDFIVTFSTDFDNAADRYAVGLVGNPAPAQIKDTFSCEVAFFFNTPVINIRGIVADYVDQGVPPGRMFMIRRDGSTLSFLTQGRLDNVWRLYYKTQVPSWPKMYIYAAASGANGKIAGLRCSGFKRSSDWANYNFLIDGNSIANGVDARPGGFLGYISKSLPFSQSTFTNIGLNGGRWNDLVSRYATSVKPVFAPNKINVILTYETTNSPPGVALADQIRYSDLARLDGWRVIHVTAFDRKTASGLGDGINPPGHKATFEYVSSQMMQKADRLGDIVEGRVFPFNDASNLQYWDIYGVHPTPAAYPYLAEAIKQTIMNVG